MWRYTDMDGCHGCADQSVPSVMDASAPTAGEARSMMTRWGDGTGEPPPFTPRDGDADPEWQPQPLPLWIENEPA
ncbi:hypothetical protein GCM10009555_103410 [Acrocarpospora macrocephala]